MRIFVYFLHCLKYLNFIFFCCYYIMETGLFVHLISNSIGAMASGGWVLWKLRQSAKKRVFIVLTERKTGLTTQLEKIKEQVHSNCVVVDLERAIKSEYEQQGKLQYLKDHDTDLYEYESKPLVKSYIKKLTSIHTKKIIVLFTSDHSIVEYLKVSPKQVALLLPTLEFQRHLLDLYENPVDKSLLQESREHLLVMTANKKYPKFLYRNFSQLESILEKLLCPIGK